MTTKTDMENALSPTEKGPSHYKKYKIQPWEFIRKNNLTPFQANVIKYVMRFQDKGGIDDLNKIKHYCDLELNYIREDWDEKHEEYKRNEKLLKGDVPIQNLDGNWGADKD